MIKALHPETNFIHTGIITQVKQSSYKIKFDNSTLGEEEIPDINVMPLQKVNTFSKGEVRKRKLEEILLNESTPKRQKTEDIYRLQTISPHSIDLLNVSNCLTKLRKKEQLIQQLSEMNNEAEKSVSILK